MIKKDLVVVGGGPAGLAAAISAYDSGVRDILLLERDQYLGGLLNQCIHTGFGIDYFKENLTGPEYADRFIKRIRALPGIKISLRSFVVRLKKDKTLTYLVPGGLHTIRPKALIMARRFTLEGAKVKAIIEIQPQTRGLVRNLVQCVEDFGIPIYFDHKVLKIHGKDRVEKVSVAKVDNKASEIPGTEFDIECDTVLVSVGLIPENELVEMAGVAIDARTNSPISKEVNRTSIPGVFVCGNSFKVYDYVDSVTRDSELAGKLAAEYIRNSR